MDPRKFLKVVGWITAGIGIAAPLSGSAALNTMADDPVGQGLPNALSGLAMKTASGLATILGQEWLVTTDPDNIGRSQSQNGLNADHADRRCDVGRGASILPMGGRTIAHRG
jgi:hypothetical protein